MDGLGNVYVTGGASNNAFRIQFGMCGDGGLLDPGKQCDDGNNQGGDGCSADCLVEGGGIPVLPESGVILFAVLLLGTSMLMLRKRLRSRI